MAPSPSGIPPNAPFLQWHAEHDRVSGDADRRATYRLPAAKEHSMEPTAHDLAEISSELQPPPSIEAGIDAGVIATLGSNGHGAGRQAEEGLDLRDILHALQAVRFGDFSV